jgi:crossover junction endodeoxyribonuclease RuvC
METTIRVLGIDPGLNITGYGAVDVTQSGVKLVEAGVIRSKAKTTLTQRAVQIHEGVRDVIAALEPSVVSLEELYSHYERPRTAILMGHARGVICLAAGQAHLEVYHYAATKIKKLLTGNGRAPKSQVQSAIQREFQLSAPPDPPDVADALAIALCHVFMSRLTISVSAP